MHSKLILVEGIPGSGKSTFAQKIADCYSTRGQKTNLYTEGDYHPADLAWNARLPLEELDNILAPYSAFRADIDKNTHIEDGYAIISYTHVTTDTPEFYKAMEDREVYDSRIPFPEFRELIHKRWLAFGTQAKEKDELTIFECAFLQNQVTELMLMQLADTETMIQYFNDLISTVLPLSPVLFYLSQTNVRETITRVAKQRVSEYGSWIDASSNTWRIPLTAENTASMASMM
ncbi:hypothetical protein [Eisenbergiella tayi]|uniref:hypothetical protein n=1 Tax=Eisenbergiella tayi TaxID=1432052 RepID=UPI00046F8F88|nr:hypothetical protein [Eisenbergiella tayi]